MNSRSPDPGAPRDFPSPKFLGAAPGATLGREEKEGERGRGSIGFWGIIGGFWLLWREDELFKIKKKK